MNKNIVLVATRQEFKLLDKKPQKTTKTYNLKL